MPAELKAHVERFVASPVELADHPVEPVAEAIDVALSRPHETTRDFGSPM